MNKIILVGGLTKDPELSTTNNGKQVCRFSIGVKRDFTGTDQPESDYFNCVAWGGLGETCGKYLKKGSKVLVEGQMLTHSYEKDNIKRTVYDVNVSKIEFLSNTKTGDKEEKVVDSKNGIELTPIDDDMLPF
jgi:single-strand DNA-binding protein